MRASLAKVVVVVLSVACLLGAGQPVSEGPVVGLRERPGFALAEQVADDRRIRTHVIGKMDDLEATTWVSSLSELNFTFPPEMAKSLDLEDATDSP